MRGTPPEAIVDIDERAVGTLDLVAQHGVALPPGMLASIPLPASAIR